MPNPGNHITTCYSVLTPGVSRHNFFFKRGLLIIVFFLYSSSKVIAQQETDYAIQANIIYHFTKYIDWPDDKKNGDFIIGVDGDSPIYEELKKNLANKMAGDQKIVVKKFSSTSGNFNCHILFIAEDQSSNIKKIVSKTSGTPTLLVSESEGLAQKGSCINFIVVSERLKLEINKNIIQEKGLNIASELLQLGKVVK